MKRILTQSLLLITLLIVGFIYPAATLAEQSHVKAVQTLASDKQSAEVYEQVKKLIASLHVSGVTSEQLGEADTIEGMIALLDDPYTEWFTPDHWTQFEDQIEQEYVGIGVRVSEDEHGVYVVDVFDHSPAQLAELQAGDYIRKVEGQSTNGKTMTQVVDAILGPEGTSVTIELERGGTFETVTMVRSQVHVPVIRTFLFNNQVGYMQISSFSINLDQIFSTQLAALEERGMTSLILDVRNNPGGYLNAAQRIARHFIEEGVLIYTKNRYDEVQTVSVSNGRTSPYPVVILVNENSASASEILSGALQDYGVAQLVGTPTYGKGSVQSSFELLDGSTLKITTQHYYTPQHHPVHEVGITPDVIVKGSLHQLITALYVSGLNDLTIELTSHQTLVGGWALPVRLDWIKEKAANQEAAYLPSRFLAVMIGGEVMWDNETKTVTILDEGRSAQFQLSQSSTRSKAGTTYIAMDAFHSAFPEWSGEIGEGRLILHTKGEVK